MTRESPRPIISIITATYNAQKNLPQLISDLQSQTVKSFQWVIADGASNDKTLCIISEIQGLNIKITSASDFGIYDALNRGIKISDGEYYLVIGADDRLYPNAIASYQQGIINTNADIISAKVNINGRQVSAMPNSRVFGLEQSISSHSVGAIFRKTIHHKLGFYSKKFPICADRLFVSQAVQAGVSVAHVDFLVGEFCMTGVTGSDLAGLLTETFRVNRLCGQSRFQQFFLLLLRLLRNYKSW